MAQCESQRARGNLQSTKQKRGTWDLAKVLEEEDSVLRALSCRRLSDLQYLHTLWRLYFLDNSVLLKLCWTVLAIMKADISVLR